MSAPQSEELAAPAWHGPAFNPRQRYTAGLLRLKDGRLSFTSDAGVQFDLPVAELTNLGFSMGDTTLKVTANGTKWRFFFAQPQGASPAVAAGGALAVAGGAAAAVTGTKAIVDSRRVGKAFKQALAAS